MVHTAAFMVSPSGSTLAQICANRNVSLQKRNGCQGLIGDALFWQGVYDEVGDRETFEEIIAPKRGETQPPGSQSDA